MVFLTIGMATYNDFDGVYFTVQALRLYHDLSDTELLVVDNYGCEHTKALVEGWAKGRYVLATEVQGTAAPRDRVFREAQGEAVLCCDSHVLFAPGAIARLKAYYREHPDTRDLLQGPLVYDDLRTMSTHFEPVWREQMWGIWATDARGLDPEGEPFDIWGQGLGVFSCRKAAWPGFHPAFRGFGGEEGYIHEKVRQRGGRTLCLPWLRWGHRFGRPAGVPYVLTVEDKVRNYLIGHAELGLDLAPVLQHFAEYLPKDRLAKVADEAVQAASQTFSRQTISGRTGNVSSSATPAGPDTSPEGTGDAGAAVPDIVLFVLGGAASLNNSVTRDFPQIRRKKGESAKTHLARVRRAVDAAIDAGGTHLLIPREMADCLVDSPLLATYLAEHHELTEADPETGLVFALRRGGEPSPQ